MKFAMLLLALAAFSAGQAAAQTGAPNVRFFARASTAEIDGPPKLKNYRAVFDKIEAPETYDDTLRADVEAMLDENGLVTGVQFRSRIGDSRVLETLQHALVQLEFTPATAAGKPVAGTVRLPVAFLPGDSGAILLPYQYWKRGDGQTGQEAEKQTLPSKSAESANGTGDKEPHPNMFIKADKQPVPLNLQEIANKIEYPQSLREKAFRQGALIEGRVLFRVLVDEEGNYVKHIVSRSPDEAFTSAGEAHLKELRFSPAIAAGEPIKFWVNVPINFTMNKRRFKAEYKRWKKKQQH